MPTTRTFSKAFSGGEISPEMFGRIDDSKYQQGAATMLNFIAKPQGPAENRSGFKFVAEVKDNTKPTRLLSFTFNTTQTMIIEFGHEYFRFHTQGSTLQYNNGAAWNSGTNYVVGDIALYNGVNYYSKTIHSNSQPPNATNWYALPADYTYEIPHPYQQDAQAQELFDVHYVQSADVITLVHPSHSPKELRRLGASQWVLSEINFGSPLSAPSGLNVAAYIPSSASANTDTYEDHKYVVTAIGANLVDESAASNPQTVANNIYVTGAKNTITWSAVSGAARYRVYKEQAGVYGFLGETDLTTIVDANIAPDFSRTPPLYDNPFSGANNFPGAVSYFEQRRVFAGTNNDPQTIYMAKSGTESNMSFGIPIRDDDRIKFRVAAREANTIRHIVPLTQLLLLTGSAEWRIASVNSDAITPTSISVKPQSYVGANNAQPVIVNNSMVYAAARGGHVRELGYNWQANGFITGDLSLRAPHLFDNFLITDMALSKAPLPIVWMISSSGKLLGFTYVPEQGVGAWHQHDTDGQFESVACVSEGNDDVVYCVIKRTINGVNKRYVERMGTRLYNTQRESFFVDAGATYDGTNTDTNQNVTISGGTTYLRGASVTITANYNLFNAPSWKVSAAYTTGNQVVNSANRLYQATGSISAGGSQPTHTSGTTNNWQFITTFSTTPSDDVGDAIVLVSGTEYYRCNIMSTSSRTVATVKLDRNLPSNLINAAVTTYEVARNVISGITWLESKKVSILADGAVHPQKVVTNGTITLDRASSIVHIGLPYNSDLKSLPLALQAEAFGQGRVKNVNHVWVRVLESSGIFAGPSPDKLVEAKQRTTEPYGSPPNLKTEDIKIMLTPTWQDTAQLFLRQSDPLPLTVVGLTLEVAIGG